MKKNRYILLVLFFVVTVYLFQAYFLVPESERMREAIAAKYGTLQQQRGFLAGAGSTEEEIAKAIEEMAKLEKRLLNEKSEFLASAGMQRLITEMTDNAGLAVMTLRPMAAVKEKGYSLVPVYFEGNGSIKQVSDFLRAVEAHSLLFKVDKLSLNVTNIQNPGDLRFKIQVTGLNKT